jgi:hypothetical protein
LRDSEGVEGEIEIERFVFGAEVVRETPALLIARTNEGDGSLAKRAGEVRDVVEMRFETFGLWRRF